MAGLDLVTPPAAEPLSLAQAKSFLRIDHSEEDDDVTAAVMAARNVAEAFLKMSLLTTGWRHRIDGGFPREIRLPIGPVIDADNLSISYVDDAGETQTLDAGQYRVSLGETAVIRPAYGCTWPGTQPVLDAVIVLFEAGWSDPEAIPPAVRQALRMMTSDAFEFRENKLVGSFSDPSMTSQNLMMPFVRTG